jgi:large conductance mechanosensitive channel
MDGFKKFLLRGNVVDLAVAVVIGVAFGMVVNGFVDAFIAPLIGLATGAAGDFSEATFSVGDGDNAVDFPYGQFVQALLSFLIIAAVVYFLVVRPVTRLMERYKTEPEVDSITKQCPECMSNIPVPASRCAFCTVEQLDVPR